MINFKDYINLEESVFSDKESYVHNSVKRAHKTAERLGKKVVLSAGGYYKVVGKDHPAKEVKPDPDREKKIAHHEGKLKELSDKKAKNPSKAHKFEQEMTKHRTAIRKMPHHIEV